MRRVAILFSLIIFPITASAQIDSVSVSGTGGQSERTWHGQASVRAINFEIAHALSPRTDVGLVVAPLSVRQPRSWFGDEFGDGDETARAISASLLLRRRFNIDSPRRHYYGEAAMGPMWSDKPIPAATSRFNFVTQFGAGIVLRPQTRFPVIAGYRFLHVSNGGYSPRNPGLNISSVVVGVRLGGRTSSPPR